MPRPKIRLVSPDEVKISREGDTAVFTYADEKNMGSGMHLKIGEKIHKMTDSDLLERHNEIAASMLTSRIDYDHVAVEIPVGKPQIEFDKCFNQWSMKGDVIRGYIGCNSDTEDGAMEPAIEVDGKIVSWKEFGKMLMTFEGWGMRLAIMPDDEMHVEPKIVIADSREEYMKEQSRD